MSYILLDIGGTKTRIAVTEDLKTIVKSEKIDTPQSFEDGVKAIVKTAQKLTNSPMRGVAGGIRGLLDSEKSCMLHDAGNALTDWEEKPLQQKLMQELETTVLLENDTALAGLGEATYGAGAGHEIVVYHTVSTGVGGVKIEQNTIDMSTHGFEPGHQILDIDHTILGEDVEPTLENLVSGTAVTERMGVKPYEIDQSDALWDQLAYFLAHGLRNSILYWSPDIIVLGGSMIVGDPRILLDDIIAHTNTVMGDITEVPLLVDAKLRDDAGLYGAMALLSHHN